MMSKSSEAGLLATGLSLAFLCCALPPVASAAEPEVKAFKLPRTAAKLVFPVTAFEATGKVSGYAITATPIPSAPDAKVWTAAAPKNLTAKEPGVYDYYAWVKNAAGKVSLFAEQTVDVATTKVTVGPKGRDFTNLADALAAIEKRGNPKGCVIEADAGEYPSWRDKNEYKGKPAYLKNITKIRVDNLTIRGVGGRAHLTYKCRGPNTKLRWTIGRGPQHGSVMVQAAKNLRLENIEVSGGCNANSGNGAGLWIEPSGVGTVIRNCYFHHNDDGILTSRIPGSRIVIMNSEFFKNGAPRPHTGGQTHNAYIGEVDELVYMFNYSHASHRGQLLKSRAGRNYVLYNKLIDVDKSNYPIDLPYGGESYVIGNLVQKSKTAYNDTFINYGREMVMHINYREGGPEQLKDKMTVTNKRTGLSYKLHYNFNARARGKWANRDRANFCNMRITEADKPDFRPGDKLSYGKESTIEVVDAHWKWSSPKREIYVCNNTFVNYNARGYSQQLLRAHIDTKLALARNNLIIDLHPKAKKFGLRMDVSKSKRIREKAVVQEGNSWHTSDPGLVSLEKFDYRLKSSASAAIDKGKVPGSANGMDLTPRYEYVHPCKYRKRYSNGKLDVGACEYRVKL